MKKKLMILGGGSSQIELIKECARLGYHTILADMNENAPGRVFADSFEKASTFDIDAVVNAAEKNNIDAVLTAGTDQPVLTAAAVAEKLNLPHFLDKNTALKVTNKRFMKNIFFKKNIPSQPYTVINKYFDESDLSGLNSPYVIKPFDSQGQRGIFKTFNTADIRNLYDTTVSFSRNDKIIVEEYYDSDEITVSGWVNNGKVYIFTVTDRITFDNPPTIGVCSSHVFPSAYSKTYESSIIETTVSITEYFGIKDGPIYFQYLIGNKGLRVNEIACRLGGAYEDEFIPLLTGINIRKLLIKGSLGQQILEKDFNELQPYTINNYNSYLSIPLLFCREGTIKRLIEPNISGIESLLKFSFIQKKGTRINNLKNSTQRAGYSILLANNHKSLNSDIEKLFNTVTIENDLNENIIINKSIESKYNEQRRFT